MFENALAEVEVLQSDLIGGTITDEAIFKPITSHVTTSTAFSEVWELGSYILLQLLGKVHNDDIVAVMNLALRLSESGSITDHVKVKNIKSVISDFTGFVKIVKKGIGKRKKTVKNNKVSQKPAQFRASRENDMNSSIIRRAHSASSLATISVDNLGVPDINQATNALDLTVKKNQHSCEGG